MKPEPRFAYSGSRRRSETTPLVVDGAIYHEHTTGPRHRARCGDRPGTMGIRSGKHSATSPTATSRSRGRARGSTPRRRRCPCRRRTFESTAQAQLFALDARRTAVRRLRAAAPWICVVACRIPPFEPARTDDLAAAWSSTTSSSPAPRSATTAVRRRRAAKCAASTRAPAAFAGRGIRFRRTPTIRRIGDSAWIARQKERRRERLAAARRGRRARSGVRADRQRGARLLRR